MAIQILQGFNVTSASPIDSRFVLTKAQMREMNDNLMPTKYFAICSDDNQIYFYDKFRIANGETGKFEPIIEADNVVIRGYYFNNKFYTDSTYTIECTKDLRCIYIDNNSNGTLYTWDGISFNQSVKHASDTLAGIMKLYQNGGQNEDGAISQKAVTDGVRSIKFDVDDEDDECLVIDLPWGDL